MNIEPIYDVMRADCCCRISKTQALVEASATPPLGVTVSKVLSTTARCEVYATECFTGEARYSGRANFTVLFADGNGKAKCVDFSSEFTGKITDECISGATRPTFTCSVVEASLLSVTQGAIKCSCIAEIELYAALSEEVKHLAACGGDAECKEEQVELAQLVANRLVRLTASRADTVEDCVGIVKTDCCAVVKKTESLLDSVAVTGEAIVSLMLESEGGRLYGKRVTLDFTEDVALEGCVRGAEVLCDCEVKSVSSRLITEDGVATVECECEIELCLSAYATSATTCVTDLFCVENKLEMQQCRKTLCKKVYGVCFTDQAIGSVPVEQTGEEIERVVCYDCCAAVVSAVRNEQGTLVVEGVISGTVTYYDKEGAICSLNVSYPFSLSREVNPCAVIDGARVTVTEVSGRLKRGEIELKAELSVAFSARIEEKVGLICEVRLLDARNSDRSALSIHLGIAGEQLFDVAKALCCPPEEVLRQNPSTEFPLSGGERVLLYRNLSLRS